MKKIICLLLLAVNIFCVTASADTTELTETDKKDLYNFEIMIGDENGNLRLKDNITRAELCKMICVALGFKNNNEIKHTVTEDFYDVTTNHWAYTYIQIASGLSLIENIENGYFRPDDSITLEDTIKIIVTALGYKPKAEKEGYINIAEKIGLMNKNSFEFKKYTLREDAAYLISNALDIPLLQQTSFGKDAEYTVMDGTDSIPLITLRTNLKK